MTHLTKEEIEIVHRAAEMIERGENTFTCYAIYDADVEKYGDYVKAKHIARMYGITYNKNRKYIWAGLPRFVGSCTQETQSRRIIMLLLFAHLGEIGELDLDGGLG